MSWFRRGRSEGATPEILKRKPIRSLLSKRPTLILEKPLVELLGLDPQSEVLAIDRKVPIQEVVEITARLPWAKGWAEGIAKLAGYVPGTPEYNEQVERLSKFVARRLVGLP